MLSVQVNIMRKQYYARNAYIVSIIAGSVSNIFQEFQEITLFKLHKPCYITYRTRTFHFKQT